MQKLKEFRKAKGLTLKQVAEKIGVAECTYCAYENGARRPSFEQIPLIAAALGVSVEHVVECFTKKKE